MGDNMRRYCPDCQQWVVAKKNNSSIGTVILWVILTFLFPPFIIGAIYFGVKMVMDKPPTCPRCTSSQLYTTERQHISEHTNKSIPPDPGTQTYMKNGIKCYK